MTRSKEKIYIKTILSFRRERGQGVERMATNAIAELMGNPSPPRLPRYDYKNCPKRFG